MANQKVRITQLPTLVDGDDAVIPVNKNNVDYRLPVKSLLQSKNNLSEVDPGQSRNNLGVYSKEEIDAQNKDSATGLRRDLASAEEGKGLSLVAAEDGTNGQQLFDEAVRLVGNYEDGPLTLTSENYEIRKGGIKYYLAPGISLPYTTTGTTDATWEVDKAKFFIVGDKGLRKDLSSDNDGLGDSLIAIKQPYSGAVARTQHEKNTDIVSIKDFGAKGDGVTDDTTSIQSAIDFSSKNGVGIYAPSGRYKVSTLIIKPNMAMYGDYIGNEGKGTSFLGNGFDDVMRGANTDDLMQMSGTGADVEYAHHVTIIGIEIDGGVNGQSIKFDESKKGRGIAVWGSSLNFVDIDIINCGGHGIESGYHDSGAEWALYFRESSFRNIRIRNVGKHGWWFKGPHDAKLVDVSIINASRCADNKYDGFYQSGEGSCDIVAMHISCSGTRGGDFENLRHRYAANISGGAHVVGSSFEGARSAQLRLSGAGSYFDSTCSFYAPFGTSTNLQPDIIYLDGAIGNVVMGNLDGSGYPSGVNAVGIKLNPSSINARNDINVRTTTIANVLNFGSSSTEADGDSGDNYFKIKSTYYGDSPYGTYGVLNSANGSALEIRLLGKERTFLDSRSQSAVLKASPGESVTWVYKYPFKDTPVVNFSIANPTGPGDVSAGAWISSVGNTSVTIYNSNNSSFQIHVSAKERVNYQ
ncbi:Pectate lyase superfamily protein [Rosenbergiella nectarea]|uniref:Pectate lyase superfamily protein n=1 Tax=Rosenbergiella nectarea TaxID=988801 RepID=A0A1H9HRE8_9GAMM|nr:glycosyl hydrolase family 28-related protein [Rosenbergiella nectarea]SEQ64856.1 Pectate lyase superfamily protein [Rosenbergiella nectarea]